VRTSGARPRGAAASPNPRLSHAAAPLLVSPTDGAPPHDPRRPRARLHRDHRRPRAQPRRPVPVGAEEPASWSSPACQRLRQVEPRLRHALRRGATALRRDALSAYARQFLGQMERPHVERLRGLSPTIAIEQKSASGTPAPRSAPSPRSTTICGSSTRGWGSSTASRSAAKVQPADRREIAREILARPAAPRPPCSRPSSSTARASSRSSGPSSGRRVLVRDRSTVSCTASRRAGSTRRRSTPSPRRGPHHGRQAGDRGRIDRGGGARPARGQGRGPTSTWRGRPPARFSRAPACCGVSFPSPPRRASRSTARSACAPPAAASARASPSDPELIIPDPSRSIREAPSPPGPPPWTEGRGLDLPHHATPWPRPARSDLDTPWKKLPKKPSGTIVLLRPRGAQSCLSSGASRAETHGTWGMRFEGVIPTILRRYHETTSERSRENYRKFMPSSPCAECGGRRLRPESLAVQRRRRRASPRSTAMPVAEAQRHFFAPGSAPRASRSSPRGPAGDRRAPQVPPLNVGLDYLTLDRSGPTLSRRRGPAHPPRQPARQRAQRGHVRARRAQSIGLHQRDNRPADLHAPAPPGSGQHGARRRARRGDHARRRPRGRLRPGGRPLGRKGAVQGTPAALAKASATSLTGAYLAGRGASRSRAKRRPAKAGSRSSAPEEHNLKNIDVRFPLGVLVRGDGGERRGQELAS
jgi:excinuclease ABC subunit A